MEEIANYLVNFSNVHIFFEPIKYITIFFHKRTLGQQLLQIYSYSTAVGSIKAGAIVLYVQNVHMNLLEKRPTFAKLSAFYGLGKLQFRGFFVQILSLFEP